MTIPVRIQCSKSYPPQEDVLQSDNNRWKWWELALVAAIVLAGIWALFATAEAQIVRGMI